MPPSVSAEDAPRPYEGPLGRTRRVTVSVPGVDGSFVAREVFAAVNVATHPELRSRCLEGTLHGAGPAALAIPYVFHDPEAACFVLVMPVVLRHRLQAERSALMARLAEEKAGFVPGYVAGCHAVVGPRGLARALGDRSEEPASEAEVELVEEPEAALISGAASPEAEDLLLESVELLDGAPGSEGPGSEAPTDEEAADEPPTEEAP